MSKVTQGLAGLTVIAAVLAAENARATEFGNTHADLGYIDTLAGIPLAPGYYFRDDVLVQNNNKFMNADGNPVNLNLGTVRLGAKFRNTVVADVVSAAYVPDYHLPFLNASIGIAAYLPIANSRATLSTIIGEPQRGTTSKGGIGDLTVVPLFLGFNVPGTDFHFVFSPFEFTAPTGRYDRNDPIGNNIGTNYWSYRPALEFTYLNKTGQEFSLNMSASINGENPATHYKSGEEFYFTYVFQQYLSPKFALGLGGYYYKQVGNDTVNGNKVYANPLEDPFDFGPGNKGETFAIGPVLSYNPLQRLAFEAHWDHELFAYDRSKKDVFWVRGAFRF